MKLNKEEYITLVVRYHEQIIDVMEALYSNTGVPKDIKSDGLKEKAYRVCDLINEFISEEFDESN